MDTNTAVNAIRRASFVYLKRGLGNDYQLISVDDAMKVIENSGYGAGVKVNDAGMLYVSVPCMADLMSTDDWISIGNILVWDIVSKRAISIRQSAHGELISRPLFGGGSQKFTNAM